MTVTIGRRSGSRLLLVRTLRRNAHPGRNIVRIVRRLRGRSLRPGRHVVRIWARDAAGNRSAARRVAFRVLAG